MSVVGKPRCELTCLTALTYAILSVAVLAVGCSDDLPVTVFVDVRVDGEKKSMTYDRLEVFNYDKEKGSLEIKGDLLKFLWVNFG